MSEPLAPGEVNTHTSQAGGAAAPGSPAGPQPVTGPTGAAGTAQGDAAVAVNVGAGAGAGAKSTAAADVLQDVTASDRAFASNRAPANGVGPGAGAGADAAGDGADDILPLEPMAPPQMPGTNEASDAMASMLVDTHQSGDDESQGANDAAAKQTPGEPAAKRPTSLAERTMSRRNLVLQTAAVGGGAAGGGELKPEQTAELAQEAAHAATAAAQEAENALAIAEAAQVTEMNEEELKDALEDDGLSGAAPELLEIKDAQGNIQSVRAVVPLTKTKHSLSFRFLGREMLDGKTFEDPDLGHAKEHYRSLIFMRGRGSMCARAKDMAKLGAGVNLYLNLQCYLLVLFVILSLLATPSFLLANGGHRISEEDMDPLGLARYTLGNNGEAEVAAAGNTTVVNTNTTYVSLAGRQLKAVDVSRLLTALDFLGCVVFLCFILFFKWRISRLSHSLQDHTISVGDYAVFVKGLPHDATKEEVMEHFSSLYDLSKPSWTWKGFCGCCHINGRTKALEPVPSKAPVTDCSNTGDASYEGKWVCEVSMAYRNGSTIRMFRKMGKVLNSLTEAKYAVQRYAEASKHANPERYQKAMAKRAKVEAKLIRLQKLQRLRNVESRDVVGAFVTFQHAESAYRCRADYHYTFSTRCQPMPVRFRGKHRLKVEAAPPPSDVIWENIETSRKSVFCRRAATNAVLFFLLVSSFLLILLAQKQKAEFNQKLPRLDMCDVELPAKAYQTYNFPSKATLRRVRGKDFGCGDNKFYLEYYDPDNATLLPPVGYSECTANCLQTTDARSCARLDGKGNYPLSTVVGCYCLGILKQYVAEHGVFSGAAKARDAEGDLCIDSLSNFVAAQSLLIVAALSVVFINVVLQRVLKALARFERHDTVSHEQLSMTFKVFLAQLLNTGIIVLIVHARLPNVDPNDVPVSGIGLFSGDHEGFGVGWYSTVGVSIMLTMLVQAIVPHMVPLLRALVLRPCKRCCTRRFKMSQESLNRLYTPQTYDLSQRYPFLLNTLFVTMMYSAGLPLLLPLAALSYLVSFWVDKLLIMRLSASPPHYNESLAVRSLKIFPYALILHLCITIWMFGNNEVLQSGVIDPTLLDGVSAGSGASVEAEYELWREEQEASWDKLGVTTKIVRENVFPLFFLLLLVLLLLIVVRVALAYFIKCLVSVFHALTCGRCATLEQSIVKPVVGGLEHEHDGGFTDEFNDPVPLPYVRRTSSMTDAEYTQRLQDKLNRLVDKEDRAQGWRIETQKNSDGSIKGAHLTVVWTSNGISEVGLVHSEGAKLRVWEVVLDSGSLYTYHPMANPKYTKVLVSIRQAQQKVDAAKRRLSNVEAGRTAAAIQAAQARAYAEQVAYAQRLAAQQAAYATNAQQRSMYQQQVALAQRRAQQQQQFVQKQQLYARQQAAYSQQHAQFAASHGVATQVVRPPGPAGPTFSVPGPPPASFHVASPHHMQQPQVHTGAPHSMQQQHMQQQRLQGASPQQQQAYLAHQQQQQQQRLAQQQQQLRLAQQQQAARIAQLQQQQRMQAMTPKQRQQHLAVQERMRLQAAEQAQAQAQARARAQAAYNRMTPQQQQAYMAQQRMQAQNIPGPPPG